MSGILTGFGALEQVMKDSASKGNFEGKLDYFNLSDGERIVVRFLTDDIITTDFAERVRTADGKFQDFTIPDPSNNLVTRYMAPGAWDGKLKKKTIGVAVVREQMMVTNPDLTDPNAKPTYQVVDKIVTRDDGLKGRVFLCVKQAHQNFWDQLVGFFGLYNTICDRDYVIMRQGKQLDTKYRIGPLDPAPNDPLRDPKVVAETYGYGRPWNKEDPERFMYCPKTLKEWFEDYGSEDRIKHFLVGSPQAQTQQQMAAQGPPPAWAQPPNPWDTPGQAPAAPAPNGPAAAAGIGEFHPATTSNPVQPPAQPAPPVAPPPAQAQVAPAEDTDFASLRNRMKSYQPGQPGQQTT